MLQNVHTATAGQVAGHVPERGGVVFRKIQARIVDLAILPITQIVSIAGRSGDQIVDVGEVTQRRTKDAPRGIGEEGRPAVDIVPVVDLPCAGKESIDSAHKGAEGAEGSAPQKRAESRRHCRLKGTVNLSEPNW